jgi:protein tyrosine kinase modulator
MADHEREESGFKGSVEIWRRRKWIALTVFLAVAAAAVSFVISLPPLYRSTATVLVERAQVPETFVRPAVTGEIEGRLQTISQEVLSRARLDEMITRFELYPELRQRGAREAAVEQMRRDIRLEPKAVDQPGTRAVTTGFALSYVGPNPETVARVTNALAGLYVEQNLMLRERQANGTAEFLKVQVAEVKRKLDEQDHRIGAMPPDSKLDLATLEGLNTRLRMNSDHQLRTMDRRERLVKELRETGTVDPGTATDLPGARLAKLRAELGALRTQFTDKYPDVIRVKEEIAKLEREGAAVPTEAAARPPEAGRGRVATVSGSGTTRPAKDPMAEVESELRRLQDEERSLRQAIVISERRIENAPRALLQYQREARDSVATKEQYESLVKRYEDAQLAESMEQGQRGERFRVLDPAVPAHEPVAPKQARLLLTGLMLSLGLTVGAVMLTERADTSFHSMDDLRAFSRVPVLAGIPPLRTEADAAHRRRRFLFVAALTALGLAAVAVAVHVFAHGNAHLVRLLAGV